ncbi:MAG: flippase [Pirellulales bacterium]
MAHFDLLTKYLPAPLRDRLEGRPNLGRILTNIGWLFGDRILRLGVGLVVTVLLTRYLGPEQFGSLSYAIAFTALLLPISYCGLDNVVVRDLVHEPTRTQEIVGTAFLLKAAFGAVTFVVAILAAAVIQSDDLRMQVLIVIAGTSLLFQAFDAIDFWFQAQVRSKFTVLARNASFLLVAALRLALVLLGAPLLAFAIAFALEFALTAVGLVIVYRLDGQHLRAWRPSKGRAIELLQTSWPIMLAGLAFAVSLRIDQIMLAEMLGTAQLGIYAAAVRLSELWYMVPAVVIHSVAPAIAVAKKTDPELYQRRLQQLLKLMVGLAYLVAIPTTLLAGPIVYFLYGPEFAASAPTLAVHIWAALFINIGGVQNLWIIHEGLTRYAIVSTSFGACINIALNWLLIPELGPVGAAVATLTSYGITFTVVCFAYPPTRRFGTMMLKALALRG